MNPPHVSVTTGRQAQSSLRPRARTERPTDVTLVNLKLLVMIKWQQMGGPDPSGYVYKTSNNSSSIVIDIPRNVRFADCASRRGDRARERARSLHPFEPCVMGTPKSLFEQALVSSTLMHLLRLPPFEMIAPNPWQRVPVVGGGVD